MTQTNPLWERNDIQFPRLLAEILSTIEITSEDWAQLRDSMDLEDDDLQELFDRANDAWEKAKNHNPTEIDRQNIYTPVTTSLAALDVITPEQLNRVRILVTSWKAQSIGLWRDDYKTQSLLFTLYDGQFEKPSLSGLIEANGSCHT